MIINAIINQFKEHNKHEHTNATKLNINNFAFHIKQLYSYCKFY